MPVGAVETRPTIDRAWLESVARDDPILHAYALWDLDHHPGRVRFASAVRGTTTLGYLLLWPLGDGGTVVHWLGDAAETAPLLDHLPPGRSSSSARSPAGRPSNGCGARSSPMR